MLRSSVSHWMQRISHQLTISRARGRRRPQPQIAAEVATLEQRALLAGVVNVAFAAGTLTITGVDNLTQAGVVGGLNDQEIQLTGGAPGQVTVAGLDGETVNGAGTFNGVTNIKLVLKEGSDRLVVDGALTLTGGLTFLGGNGDSSIEFDDGAVVSLGSLTITNLEGDDIIELTPNNTITVTGAVTIDCGAGTTGVTIQNAVFGSLKFTSGDSSSDALVFENLDVTGTSQITCGDGNAILSWLTNSTLGGNLTVSFGETSDITGHIIALNLQSAKGVTITTLSGAKNISLSGTYVGNVSLTNGIGSEDILIDDAVITGNLTIKNGSGGSHTNVTGIVAITGNLAITNLGGADELDAFGTALTVTGTTTISNGNGGGDLKLRPTGTLNLGGNLSITDGEGDNIVVIGRAGTPTQTLKNVSVNHGLGDSDMQLFGTLAMDAVTLMGGEGDHVIDFNGATTTQNLTLDFKGSNTGVDVEGTVALTVNGNLKMTTAGGRDEFSPLNLTVSGTTAFSTGGGNDFVNVSNATLTGNVSITTGSGADQVLIGRSGASTLAGNLTLNTGTGDDDVFIESVTFRGTVSVSLGAGSDFLDIEGNGGTDNGTKARFEKAVTINAEAGDDFIEIGRPNDTNDFAEFLSTLTINAGSGVDTARFKNIAGGGTRSNIFTAAPTLSGVEAAV